MMAPRGPWPMNAAKATPRKIVSSPHRDYDAKSKPTRAAQGRKVAYTATQ